MIIGRKKNDYCSCNWYKLRISWVPIVNKLFCSYVTHRQFQNLIELQYHETVVLINFSLGGWTSADLHWRFHWSILSKLRDLHNIEWSSNVPLFYFFHFRWQWKLQKCAILWYAWRKVGIVQRETAQLSNFPRKNIERWFHFDVVTRTHHRELDI